MSAMWNFWRDFFKSDYFKNTMIEFIAGNRPDMFATYYNYPKLHQTMLNYSKRATRKKNTYTLFYKNVLSPDLR